MFPYKKRKKTLENKLNKNLQEIVYIQLNINLEQFSKDLRDDDKFNELLQKKAQYDKEHVANNQIQNQLQPPQQQQSSQQQQPQSTKDEKVEENVDFYFTIYPKTEKDWYL